MLKDIAPRPSHGTVGRAKRLRREMSLPEVVLWRLLRQRPEGLKFRRQHPTGCYVLDFYCGDARLAIEVDGTSHNHGDRPSCDMTRDAWLAAAGIGTLRIPAAELLSDVDTVGDSIVAACRARLPLHHPAMLDGPPPRAKLGEE